MMRPLRTCCLLLPFVCAPLRLSHAQQPAPSESRAAEFFRAGQAAFSQRDFAASARAFEQAHALSPSGPTIYNAARAWDQEGAPETAAADYAEALKQADLSGAQRGHAQQRLKELHAQLIQVVLRGPSDHEVLDTALTPHPLPATVFVTPTTETVTVKDSAGKTIALPIRAQAGQTVEFNVPIEAAAPVPVLPAPKPRADATPSPAEVHAVHTHYLGWTGVALAVAAASATTFFGVNFLSKRSDFIDGGKTNRELRQDAVRMGTFTGIGMGVTALSAVVAVWGLHYPAPARSGGISLTVLPGAALLRGAF